MGPFLYYVSKFLTSPIPYVTIAKYSTESKQKFPFSDPLPPYKWLIKYMDGPYLQACLISTDSITYLVHINFIAIE